MPSNRLLTVLVFFMLFGGIFVGRIFDDFGPRHLLLGGTFLHVFGLMMTSISTQYYQILLSQAICSPIGASMVFYPAFNCVSFRRDYLVSGSLRLYRHQRGSSKSEVLLLAWS